MGRDFKPKLVEDECIRPLAEKARDEISLTGFLKEAGIDDRKSYNAVHRWLEGRENGKGERPSRSLPKPLGVKLRRYLSNRYPSEFDELVNSELSRMAKVKKTQEVIWRLQDRLTELEKKGRG